MFLISFPYGVSLIVLGLGGYLLTGAQSVTALIPAFFGLIVALLALWERRADGRLPGRLLILVALLATAGSFSGLLDLPAVFDGTAARPAASVSRSVMVALSLTYLLMRRQAPTGQRATL